MDLSDTNDGRTLCVLSVPSGARVLDLGGGGGAAVAEALVERGCTVHVVAPDEQTVREMRPHCAQATVADLDSVDLQQALGEEAALDAAVAVGTLQHVRAPAALLRRVAALLPPSGRLVATLPNVAHGAVRLELLRGRFRAPGDPGGEHEPLHAFDAAAARALFEGAGLSVVEQLKVTRPLDETELKIDPSAFPAEVLAEVEADPEALVYEIVFVAAPAVAAAQERALPAEATLAERLQARTEELAAEGSRARERIASLEELVASLNQRIEELSQQAERAGRLEAELAGSAEQLAALRDDRRHLELDIAVKDAYITELRTRLADEEARRARVEEQLDRTGHDASRAVAEARAALSETRASLAATSDEAERLRERAGELDRLHHRLAAKANELLLRAPSVHRTVKAAARRVARGRRPRP